MLGILNHPSLKTPSKSKTASKIAWEKPYSHHSSSKSNTSCKRNLKLNTATTCKSHSRNRMNQVLTRWTLKKSRNLSVKWRWWDTMKIRKAKANLIARTTASTWLKTIILKAWRMSSFSKSKRSNLPHSSSKNSCTAKSQQQPSIKSMSTMMRWTTALSTTTTMTTARTESFLLLF